MAAILKARLQAAAARAAPQSGSEQQEQKEKKQEMEEQELRTAYLSLGGGQGPSALPRFHLPLPGEDDVVRVKVREEARAQFLQRRSRLLLDNTELKEVLLLLLPLLLLLCRCGECWTATPRAPH